MSKLSWYLKPVSVLAFVEPQITPRQLYVFVDHILGQDETRTLPVHLLYARHNLDWEASQRLDLRLDDYDQVLDGLKPKE